MLRCRTRIKTNPPNRQHHRKSPTHKIKFSIWNQRNINRNDTTNLQQRNKLKPEDKKVPTDNPASSQPFTKAPLRSPSQNSFTTPGTVIVPTQTNSQLSEEVHGILTIFEIRPQYHLPILLSRKCKQNKIRQLYFVRGHMTWKLGLLSSSQSRKRYYRNWMNLDDKGYISVIKTNFLWTKVLIGWTGAFYRKDALIDW